MMFNRKLCYKGRKAPQWVFGYVYDAIGESGIVDGVFADLNGVSGFYMLCSTGQLVRYVNSHETEYVGNAPRQEYSYYQNYYTNLFVYNDDRRTVLYAFCYEGTSRKDYCAVTYTVDGVHWSELARIQGVDRGGVTHEAYKDSLQVEKGMAVKGNDNTFYLANYGYIYVSNINDDLTVDWTCYPIWGNFNFKGYAQVDNPRQMYDVHTGDLWYGRKLPDVVDEYPITVKVADADGEFKRTVQYTPNSFDEWIQTIESDFSRPCWFGNGWYRETEWHTEWIYKFRPYLCNGMATNNNNVIVVSGERFTLVSADYGVTWNESYLMQHLAVNEKITCVEFLNNKFIAFTEKDGSATSCYLSDNGCVWVKSGNFQEVYGVLNICIYVNGCYVALSEDGNIVSSVDAVTWTEPVIIPPDPSGAEGKWNFIRYYDNKYIVCGHLINHRREKYAAFASVKSLK